MKKAIAFVLLLTLLMTSALAETVVTSFYPIYLFALNLTAGIEEITVSNLAPQGTGCLHDYQLSIRDMKALNQADVLLVNGAGMESYLTRVIESFPELPVVDASVGIELMAADGHTDHEGHDDADHEYNAHIWLDVGNAMQMVDNLAEGLKAALPDQAEAIEGNRAAYVARLEALDGELTEAIAALTKKDIVTFHEAFPYFARRYGLNVAAVVTREPGDALSPRELATLVAQLKELGCPPLFTEPQYDDLAAETLQKETGAPMYELDPVVTGPDTDIPLTWYEGVMRKNLAVLQEALSE